MTKKQHILVVVHQPIHHEWAQKLAENSQFIVKIDQLSPNTAQNIRQYYSVGYAVVGMVSAGIIIRAIAPILGNKWHSPPVIVVEGEGQFIHCILGAHHHASHIIQAVSGITGGTIIHEISDDQPTGIAVSHPEMRKNLVGTPPIINQFATPQQFCWHEQKYSLGVGLERGVNGALLHNTILNFCGHYDINPKSLAVVASVVEKIDEPALDIIENDMAIALRFFTANECSAVQVPNPSDYVQKTIGTPSVAEAAAILASNGGALIIPKHKYPHITLALAENTAPITEFSGLARGQLYVVGVGPGADEFRSPSATQAIYNAEVVVSYDYYSNLISHLLHGKEIITMPLGDEKLRAETAIHLAMQGKRVALLASGDPGIYALAPLVYESLAHLGENRVAQSLQVSVHPSISAFQIFAARLGAPAGNDCALISLSNIMTPETIIIKRLEFLAGGGIPTFIYNPQSKTRKALLPRALEIFKRHQGGDILCAIGKNLSRPGEQIIITTIDQFPIDQVDMFSVVFLGNIYTRQLIHHHQQYIYSPRGYIEKLTNTKAI